MEESVEAPIETLNDQGPSTPEKPEPVVDVDLNAKEEVSSSEDCEKAEFEDEHPPAVAEADEQRVTEQPIEENSDPKVVNGKDEEDNRPENLVNKPEMGQSPPSRQMLLNQAGILLRREENRKNPPKEASKEDENLEKYSESLMDDDLSGEEDKEAGSGKRVRFAKEVVKIPERNKIAPQDAQNAQRGEEAQEHSPENVSSGASNEVNGHAENIMRSKVKR